MPLFLIEPGVAAGDSICYEATDRDWDVVVQLTMPKVNLSSDLLKLESPGLCVQSGFVIGSADARSKCLLHARDEHLRQLGLLQQLSIHLCERLHAPRQELIRIPL
jgi:hypothetical protein